jgi:hypothetical protein
MDTSEVERKPAVGSKRGASALAPASKRRRGSVDEGGGSDKAHSAVPTPIGLSTSAHSRHERFLSTARNSVCFHPFMCAGIDPSSFVFCAPAIILFVLSLCTCLCWPLVSATYSLRSGSWVRGRHCRDEAALRSVLRLCASELGSQDACASLLCLWPARLPRRAGQVRSVVVCTLFPVL